jgi:hypothetical protein
MLIVEIKKIKKYVIVCILSFSLFPAVHDFFYQNARMTSVDEPGVAFSVFYYIM